jgi:hypothetical protein
MTACHLTVLASFFVYFLAMKMMKAICSSETSVCLHTLWRTTHSHHRENLKCRISSCCFKGGVTIIFVFGPCSSAVIMYEKLALYHRVDELSLCQ